VRRIVLHCKRRSKNIPVSGGRAALLGGGKGSHPGRTVALVLPQQNLWGDSGPESSQVVIEGNFHRVEGAKAVGSSGNYSDFVVEAFNGTIGDFSSGPKPVQYQRLMGAQHPRHLFHRFQTAPHGTEAPTVKKGSGPHLGFVLPEMGEVSFKSQARAVASLLASRAFNFCRARPRT